MIENKVYMSDIIIHIAECLKEVDNIDINWRVLYKYASDFLDDNNLKVNIERVV